MFAATLIMFHEALEAALFVGIVAAATKGVPQRGRWLAGGVGLGLLGALLLASLVGPMHSRLPLMGPMGYDVILLGLVVLMLVWHCVWMASAQSGSDHAARQLGLSVTQGHSAPRVMAAAVALAVLREGIESFVFISGLMHAGAGLQPGMTLAHALLGLAMGVGVGVLVYAGLVRIPVGRMLTASMALIALYAASMAGQLAQRVGQSGSLGGPAAPLWDSSAMLPPESVLGSVLHLLLGYDGHPTVAQITSFLCVLVFITVVTQLQKAPQPARFPGANGLPA
jgi:high-affinity iron transporter